MTTPHLPIDHSQRMARAYVSLDGLSIGDGFGAEFCWAAERVAARRLPDAPWRWTDDTEMALSLVHILDRYSTTEQDKLAESFALHFDPGRAYGLAMLHELLPRLQNGDDWREASHALFGGSGSFGNGAAMRVAPLGAYFGDDLSRVVEEARLSAEVTHAHPEGIAGAIAVALAAARAWQLRASLAPENPGEFIAPLLPYIPRSHVYDNLSVACKVSFEVPVEEAARMLGNGSRVSAQDTVPFALWSAARNLANFEEALWTTASVFGDMDTNCAIVGGIVAMNVGREGIPQHWLSQRESLPTWPFYHNA